MANTKDLAVYYEKNFKAKKISKYQSHAYISFELEKNVKVNKSEKLTPHVYNSRELKLDSPITSKHIEEAIITMEINKSPGENGIWHKLLRWGGRNLNLHLLKNIQ